MSRREASPPERVNGRIVLPPISGTVLIPAVNEYLYAGETVYGNKAGALRTEYVKQDSDASNKNVVTTAGTFPKSDFNVEKYHSYRTHHHLGVKCKRSVVKGRTLLRNKKTGRFCKKSRSRK